MELDFAIGMELDFAIASSDVNLNVPPLALTIEAAIMELLVDNALH